MTEEKNELDAFFKFKVGDFVRLKQDGHGKCMITERSLSQHVGPTIIVGYVINSFAGKKPYYEIELEPVEP